MHHHKVLHFEQGISYFISVTSIRNGMKSSVIAEKIPNNTRKKVKYNINIVKQNGENSCTNQFHELGSPPLG